MSWAYGVIKLRDGTEIEAGYSVESECMKDGCQKTIDRGLAYRCGSYDFDKGCGRYYCGDHQYDHDCSSPCEACGGAGRYYVFDDPEGEQAECPECRGCVIP